MRILIIGGTGAIGGHAALHLKSLGHDVVLSSRNPPAKGTGLESLEWLAGNYLEGTFGQADLEGFEGIVFAAGNDVRHLPAGSEAGPEADAHYIKANGEEIPKFAALAKAAGVQCFINIGSFYPQVLPEKIETDAYVRSRDMADKGVRALSDDSFRAMSLNASFVVGHPDGMASDM
ncbi:NAD-dependent epimerase/dehydratase family protein, partial [Parasphingorhabdus sp.]